MENNNPTYLDHNEQMKTHLDKLTGQNSLNLIAQNITKYLVLASEELHQSHPHNSLPLDEVIEAVLDICMEKVASCKTIKYFMAELEISSEGMSFLRQIAKELVEDMLRIKKYKVYRFDGSKPVHLLYEDNCFKIQCGSNKYVLNYDSQVIINNLGLGFTHLQGLTPKDTGVFYLFPYSPNFFDHLGYREYILDSNLLLECVFEDGVRCCDDLERMIEYKLRSYKKTV